MYPKFLASLNLLPIRMVKKSEKQVDFDTLDLLTKRFNSKKKYSPLSKMVFDDLNRISDIPIHRTNNGVTNEFSKIAHTLNKLGVLNNNQLNNLLNYILYIM